MYYPSLCPTKKSYLLITGLSYNYLNNTNNSCKIYICITSLTITLANVKNVAKIGGIPLNGSNTEKMGGNTAKIGGMPML